ncbi:MAG: shikimate kinase [Clostridia bacterium]|nr:shikimate kinase [Clostridia bacterium]
MIFTLIGMPGAGKSCMGRSVSGKLKLPLIDSDKLIEKRYGKKLQLILDELGVDEFRRVEEEVLLSLKLPEGEHAILSTGGSAVYSKRAMDYLRTQGKVIYLYCSCKTILERIDNPDDRGIVLKPGQTLTDLYYERKPLYEAASDITVSCDGRAYPRYQRDLMEAIKPYIQ